MISVCVLMAAFNGEKFIECQLESIVAQTGDFAVSVAVGLDPSSDNTAAIVNKFKNRGVSLNDYSVPSGGSKQNFSRILRAAKHSDYPYYCLSDQDDVWCPDKLSSLYSKMAELEELYGIDTPLLVFSDSRVVDYQLNELSSSFWKYEGVSPCVSHSFKNIVLQNVAQGCSMLFNRALLDKATPVHVNAVMHDWWMMLVASAFGKVDYVDAPLFLYRQHDDNVIGSKGHSVGSMLRNLFLEYSKIKDALSMSQLQSFAFLQTYKHELSKDKIDILSAYSDVDRLGLLQRKIKCLRLGLHRSSVAKTLGFYFFV